MVAPTGDIVSSKEIEALQEELNSISNFLKIRPIVKQKIDAEKYVPLDKKERLMSLFVDFFVPKKLFPPVIEEDLAYLCAYNLLNVLEKEQLTEEWYGTRGLSPMRTDKPYLQFEDGTMYRSIHDLLEADSHTFGEFLPLLFKKVQRLRKFIREPLTEREATRYLDNTWMCWKPKLSKNDLKVALFIDSAPFTKKKAIAKALELHENSVAYILDRLEKLFFFRVYGFLNLGKLGIQKVLLTVEDRVTIEFPYLSSRQEVRAGHTTEIYSFNIPLQKGKTDPLKDLYKILQEKLDSFALYKVVNFKDSFSFQYFDLDENQWDIDWDAWALWLERILYEEQYHMISPDLVKYTDSEEKRISFDKKDLNIIDFYKLNLRMSMTDLGNQFGMSRQAMGRRVKRLRNQHVLIPVVHMRQIGLDEQIIVFYTGDEDYLAPFESALFELPVVFSYTLESFPDPTQKMLYAWLQLPPGSFIKFSDTATNILRENDAIWTAHRYQFRSGAKEIPAKMFDAQKKEWRWGQDILDQFVVKQ